MSKTNVTAIDVALRKAKQLGIPGEDLRQALILVRELRLNVLELNLDPRATRIALIFADMSDYYMAKNKLSVKELSALREIANDLFHGARASFWKK